MPLGNCAAHFLGQLVLGAAASKRKWRLSGMKPTGTRLQEHQGREKLLEAILKAEAAIEVRHRELDKLPTGNLAERLNLKTALKDLEAIKARLR